MDQPEKGINPLNHEIDALKTGSSIWRVLIVGNHFEHCQMIQNMLLLRKVNSDTASNGLVALEKLERIPYDLLIIDYQMPYLNGLQVIKEIRETLNICEEELSIILLHSSAEDSQITIPQHNLSIQQVMTKPISLKQLTTALEKIYADQFKNSPCPKSVDLLPLDQTISVLIVDDNPMDRLLAKTMVELLLSNVLIEEACDGIKAAEKAQKNLPDIIFMDLQMPNMNGYEASRIIREFDKNHQTKIMALTANKTQGVHERCLQAGIDDYISKPFVLNTLRSKLQPWLDLKAVFAIKEDTAV